MSRNLHSTRLKACTGLAVCAGAIVGWLLLRDRGDRSDPPALPPPAASEFLNSRPGAQYIGIRACAACHPGEHESFLLTAHSAALAEIDLGEEPEGGEFTHAATGRCYRVYREGGELRHREFVPTADGSELTLADYPMRYVIGSGFSRSYLAEPDGFLVESPATWYASKPGWGISPGYDRYNSGFERPAEIRCIQCHVGRVDSVDGSLQRLKIHAQEIDCERCHGPGSLHAARWEGKSEALDGADLTIVNPRRLPRAEREAVCAQCHLHSAATVEIRGRNMADYRPSLRLSDFRVYYGLTTPNEGMDVVGHVEQMRLSRCYQASEVLTCTTCHHPHSKPAEDERVEFYRSKCLNCHAESACRLEPVERRRKTAADDCVVCHMPQVPTDIVHFAFTHHRIGNHDPEAKRAESFEVGTLTPLDDVSHLPSIELDRCLGLGYVQLADSNGHNEHAGVYLGRAQRILERVRQRGIRDADVDAALARLNWGRDPQRTIEYAESVLMSDGPSPDARTTALFTLAGTYVEQKEWKLARKPLEQLVRIRRYADAWSMLSLCREREGDLSGAIEAAQQAGEIAPHRAELETRLAELYRRSGDETQAAAHERRAARLSAALKRGG
jgi:hypothetical protein